MPRSRPPKHKTRFAKLPQVTSTQVRKLEPDCRQNDDAIICRRRLPNIKMTTLRSRPPGLSDL